MPEDCGPSPSASLALATNSVRLARSYRWRRSPSASSWSREAACVSAMWCRNSVSLRAAAVASGQHMACLAFSCVREPHNGNASQRDCLHARSQLARTQQVCMDLPGPWSAKHLKANKIAHMCT